MLRCARYVGLRRWLSRDTVSWSKGIRLYSSSGSSTATATATATIAGVGTNITVNTVLTQVLKDKARLGVAEKLAKVYKLIQDGRGQVIHLDNSIHQWFWHNVPVEKSYAHYQFLIEHNVALSDSIHCKKMFRRLLQGSEVEFQLATFQVFLNQEEHVPLFKEKFHALHDFDTMLHIFNSVVKAKNFQNVKYYLSSLTEKMTTLAPKEMNRTSLRDVELVYVKFNNSLLYYLLISGNTEVFIKTFKSVQNYIKNSSLVDVFEKSPEVSTAIMKSIHLYLLLLKENNMPDLTLELLRTLQNVKGSRSKVFRRFLASTITSTLRSFNDPRLTANFVLSTHQTSKTAKTLNELGLWNYIFHDRPGILDHHELGQELINIAGKKTSDSLRPVGVMNKAILTEVYRSFLSTSANTMTQQEFEKCIRSLYEHYVSYCQNNEKLLAATKHDTGIISTILYHTRYSLQNSQLAYNILTHFYSQDFIKYIKKNVKKCPFSIIIYNNNFLPSDKLEKLFELMDKNGYPLTFHICYSMVKRMINTRNDVEAYNWYQRIIEGGFRFENRGLMDLVIQMKWEFPANFDKRLLIKLQSEEDVPDLNQVAEENSENSNSLMDSYSDLVADVKINLHI
ncbi:Mitochondrial translation factor ATP22 [Nakaseomyces bracarensis]|uniref:Mitochondrial translation factor ATP22 n=1 Tax=Nakaseomyces bracarensis TaxID=273131 RepID=A0ABR4P0J5_9SACH